MDTKPASKPATNRLEQNGLFVRGVAISNTALKITKKDGGILALVKHELALEPGTIVLQQFIDPKDNPQISIEGDQVTRFPKLELYKPYMAKVGRMEEIRGQQTATSWEAIV
ncbi:hypothetical protein [Coraliomargarita parva]|uniref:hypothetical protein n=1 Tax=Coraliomargarita parva TaxID=3014050 RepID=UPI0022B58F7C|nr:hypothetical protein [Coraliomargarita parva]